MRYLYQTIVICGLLIIASVGHAQKLSLVPQFTFKINEGATIVLHGNSTGATAYQWYVDGVRINGAVDKDLTTGFAGTYTVVAFNAEGCPSAQSTGVVVILIPPVKPDTAVDLMISIQSSNIKASPGENYDYLLTANNNSKPTGTHVQVTYVVPPQIVYQPQLSGSNTSQVSYDSPSHTLTWQINELPQNRPVNLTVPVKVLQPGVIQSIVDIKGKEFDPILANNVAQVVQQVNPLIIPNVFTPNGDGVNDTFFVPGLDTYTENEIVIINRWGNNVYEKKNYQNDWTGNGLVEGTYFYVLRVLNEAGVWDVYKGYVTLLRTRGK